MERVAKSLARLKLSDAISTEDLARAAWPAAVGKRIASHATAKCMVRDSLIVEVEDALWRKNLFQLRFQILGNMFSPVGLAWLASTILPPTRQPSFPDLPATPTPIPSTSMAWPSGNLQTHRLSYLRAQETCGRTPLSMTAQPRSTSAT